MVADEAEELGAELDPEPELPDNPVDEGAAETEVDDDWPPSDPELAPVPSLEPEPVGAGPED